MSRSKSRKIREVEAWGDVITPACGCGCGEPVGINDKGPKVFVNRAHQGWARRGSTWERSGSIEIEKFRAAVRKIKESKGWTWTEMAAHGGWSHGMLKCYMADKRYNSVGLDVATSFLRRCAGMAGEMSTHQKRMDDERRVKMRKWENEMRGRGW